jgi:2-polyprenyl-6-methoxyphenol hydroxylase-like FAD-dependent oxidoreductase
MKIGIVGGGPAGLYFALLMKKLKPSHEIQVVEQNPANNTYGWGVVFSDKTLSYLEENDYASFKEITGSMQTWDDVAVVHKGQRITIGGNTFSGIARIELLRILQAHCQRQGVEIAFEQRLTDLAPFANFDLVVGADGVNSTIREQFAAQLGATVEARPNKYIWYGTHHLFDALTLTFHQNADGVFVAHSYRFDDATSTFIVECDPDTWAQAGFESKSDEENRAYLEEVFREDLGGQALLSNKSEWLNFRVVKNQRWSHGNVVLLGDASHTAHFSIGSGTKLALEDAIALYRAFADHPEADVPEALAAFEQARKPVVDRLQNAAHQSLTWFETVKERVARDPVPFAYELMTRSGRIDNEKLRQRDPAFVAAYEAYQKSSGAG